MKICFLSAVHPPLDKRVFDKEAVSLAQHGFDVVHLAPDANETSWEQSGVLIETYRKPSGLMDRFLQLPRLYRMALRLNADWYHCNEVDSWIVGLTLKLFHRKRVVFDVHEHYPSEFPQKRFPQWAHPFIGFLIRVMFAVLTPFTDRIVFAKRTVAVDFKGSEHKQVLAQNFARLAYGGERRQHHNGPGLQIVHIGLMNRERGWPQLLDALAIAKCREIHLQLVGTFNDGSQEEFVERARELGLTDRITLDDWLPFEEAYKRVISSDVGLVLFQPGFQNHVWALPHKMFDYMMAGIPVIAPAIAEEVAYIVREAKAGLLTNSDDPSDIAQVLDRLATDPEERRRLGENGRQAVLNKYNWETEAEKLVNMYAHVESGPA